MVREEREGFSSWSHHRPLPRLPELVFCQRIQSASALAYVLAPHRHRVMEISHLESGWVRWWAGSEQNDFYGGEVHLSWPGEPHGGLHGMLAPCTLYTLQVSLKHPQGRGRGYLGLPGAEAAWLAGQLAGAKRRVFGAPPGYADKMTMMLEALDATDGAATPLGDVLRVRSLLLDLLLSVLRASAQAHKSQPGSLVRSAVEIMRQNLQRPLPLGEVAADLGCSLSYLKARFKAEMGVPPHVFHMGLRIGEAAARLPTAPSVTSVAIGMGFSSSQRFSAVFRQVTGLSPGEYISAADPEMSSMPARPPYREP